MVRLALLGLASGLGARGDALLGLPCPSDPGSKGKRPNILFMVADDLGYADVGFNHDGDSQIPTPAMDKLASQGVVLSNYYVQSVCSPTRSCIMTGRHVIHTGFYDPDARPDNTYGVRSSFTMLPQHMKCLGYATHAIGKWHLGSHRPDLVPTGRGFDTFFGYYGGLQDYYKHTVYNFRDFHDDVGDKLSPRWQDDGEYSTHLYAKRAVSVIEGFAADRRASASAPSSFFMYLAWQAIHEPDQVPKEYTDRFSHLFPEDCGSCRKTVCGMVSALDEGIGNVTAALEREGLMDETLIVFTSDNGGPAQGFDSNWAMNYPLRGMKRTLWEGGIRAAGFVSGAGLQKTGYVNKELYHVTDFFPSLLGLAINGLDADPSSEHWTPWTAMQFEAAPQWQLGDGQDIWASMATGAPSPRTEMIIEAHNTTGNGIDDGNGQAIRVGDFKLIFEKGPMWHGPPNDGWYKSAASPQNYSLAVDCGGEIPDKSAEDFCHPGKLPCLFNVRKDPCEFHDLSATMPGKVAELTRRLRAYQVTAVPKEFHELGGCGKNPSPKRHPEFNNTWMPYCPAKPDGPIVLTAWLGLTSSGDEVLERGPPQVAWAGFGAMTAALTASVICCYGRLRPGERGRVASTPVTFSQRTSFAECPRNPAAEVAGEAVCSLDAAEGGEPLLAAEAPE